MTKNASSSGEKAAMTDPLDFTTPRRAGPRERLAPKIARGRERDLSHETRAVAPIEAIIITRKDCQYQGTGVDRRTMQISLPRVKFIEGPDPQ